MIQPLVKGIIFTKGKPTITLMSLLDKYNNRSKTEKALLIGLLIALVALFILFFGPIRDFAWRITQFLMDEEGARRYFQERQPYSAFYYIGLSVLQVVISPIPGELACFLGGLIFGWGPGFVYATIGLTLGSLINVGIGRFFERLFLEKFIPARILDKFEARMDKYGLITVFILFVFPGAPKDVMCYLFGLSRIPILQFLVVSSIARMPGTFVLSLQGASVFEGDWSMFIYLTIGGMAVVIPLLIFKEKILNKLGINEGRK